MERQPAVRPPRVTRDQLVDDDATIGEVGQPGGDAQMDRAHRVRVDQRRGLERARPQDELDPIAPPSHVYVRITREP